MNGSINMKRSELSQQVESLVPFLVDGLGVEIPFQCVFRDNSEVLTRVDYFHRGSGFPRECAPIS